jgi:hypothetical protein
MSFRIGDFLAMELSKQSFRARVLLRVSRCKGTGSRVQNPRGFSMGRDLARRKSSCHFVITMTKDAAEWQLNRPEILRFTRWIIYCFARA